MDNYSENKKESHIDRFEEKDDSKLASQFPEWDLLPPVLLIRRKP